MKKKSDPPKREGDWRGDLLDRIRTVINEADPEMIEERKWKKASNGMAGALIKAAVTLNSTDRDQR